MKECHMKHKQPTHGDSLGSLLDRCGNFYAHRIGDRKRWQDSVLADMLPIE